MNYNLSRIIAGIDFSDSSLNALETAATIAARYDAVLYILNSSESSFIEKKGDHAAFAELRANRSTLLEALSVDIHKRYKIKTSVIEDQSLAVESLTRHAVKSKANLVVIGNFGESGPRKNYIGSTAYNVIKFAPCPVLVVPGEKKWGLFKRPLFPVRPILTAMRHYNFVRPLLDREAQLQIFGLSSAGEQNNNDYLNDVVSQIELKLKVDQVSATIKWSQEISMSENILSQAEKIQSDLVILTPVIDVSIKPFYIGPNTHFILNHAKMPLLVINRVHRNVSYRTPAL